MITAEPYPTPPPGIPSQVTSYLTGLIPAGVVDTGIAVVLTGLTLILVAVGHRHARRENWFSGWVSGPAAIITSLVAATYAATGLRIPGRRRTAGDRRRGCYGAPRGRPRRRRSLARRGACGRIPRQPDHPACPAGLGVDAAAACRRWSCGRCRGGMDRARVPGVRGGRGPRAAAHRADRAPARPGGDRPGLRA